MATNTAQKIETRDANRDPITGEPGSHPIGTSLGTAGGAMAGMAVGTALGPVGTVAGALIGTIVGGLAGAWAGGSIAEVVDPTAEDAYWKENYQTRPYVEKGASYDTYRPAYRYGYEARGAYKDRSFDELDNDLGSDWDKHSGSSLTWDKARPAVRDAYDRTGSMYEKYKATGSANNTGGSSSYGSTMGNAGGSATGSANAGASSNNAGLSGSGSYQSNLTGGAATSKGDKI